MRTNGICETKNLALDRYRDRSPVVEGPDGVRDCVAQLGLLRSCPDVLEGALREMGITENGDEIADAE
jgi:hypothetical protein